MPRIRQCIRDNLYLLTTAYGFGLILMGLWSGLEYIHWSVPLVMVLISFCLSPKLGNPWPAIVVSVVAVGLAVYGLSKELSMAWTHVVLMLVGIGAGISVLTWAIGRLVGTEPAAADGAGQKDSLHEVQADE
jgi:hypothetical protein